MHLTSYPKKSSTEVDIIIVGAGLVGLTLVSLLAPLGARIAIITPHLNFPVQWASFAPERLDGRMIALNPSTQQVLESIDIWQKMPTETLGICRKIRVWDFNGTEVVLENSPLLKTPMAYVVAPSLIQSLLWDKLSQSKAVTWIQSAKIQRIESLSKKICVYLDQDECIQGALLIGADGAESQVRRLSGITCTSKNYQQTALVTMIQHAASHQSSAFQIFLELGPLAFLPTADPHYSTIIWSTQSEHAQALYTSSDADFCQQLNQASRAYMKEIKALGSRYITPLYRHHANSYVKARTVLIGDAAHRPHPLAGQGANLGIADVAYLAQIITEAKQTGRDIGAMSGLRQYERTRRFLNACMLKSIDLIHDSFTQQNLAVQAIRRWGLTRLQSCSGLKRAMIQFASGFERYK